MKLNRKLMNKTIKKRKLMSKKMNKKTGQVMWESSQRI